MPLGARRRLRALEVPAAVLAPGSAPQRRPAAGQRQVGGVVVDRLELERDRLVHGGHRPHARQRGHGRVRGTSYLRSTSSCVLPIDPPDPSAPGGSRTGSATRATRARPLRWATSVPGGAMATPFRRPDRHEDRRDPRLPPGQYDAGATFPVLTAEVTPRLELDRWTFRVDGLVRAGAGVDLGRHPGAAGGALRRRHPLRHHLVQARHVVLRCVRRRPARGRRADRGSDPRGGLEPHRLHHEPAAGGRHRRARRGWSGSTRGRRCRSSTAARPAARAPPVLLEVAPSGSVVCACSTTTSRGSGRRGATTTAATPGSSSGTPVTDPSAALAALASVPALASSPADARTGVAPAAAGRRPARVADGDGAGDPPRDLPDDHPAARPAGRQSPARARSARHRPAHRAGRLHGLPVVQHRLGAHGRPRARADGRAARGRRGVRLPARRGARSATRWRCAGRSAAGSCGTVQRRPCSSAAARASSR